MSRVLPSGISINRTMPAPVPIYAAHVLMASSAFNQINSADWTLSSSGETITLTKGVAGAVNWLTPTATGLALVYPVAVGDFTSSDKDALFELQLRMDVTEGTTDGMGVGLGVVNSPTNPTHWGMRLNYRTAAGVYAVDERSDLVTTNTAPVASLPTGIHYQVVHTEFTLLSNFDNTQAFVSQKNHGNAFVDYSGDKWYPTVFAIAPAGGGTVTFSNLKLISRNVEW